MVEQHPRIVQQLKPFERRIAVLGHPPIRTVVLKVPVAKIVDFRYEILGPNPSRGVNPPRVIALRGVDNLCIPRTADDLRAIGKGRSVFTDEWPGEDS